ncbi:MAG: pyridoxal-phosphate dependent enzyme [Dehalococcoidia bacterium]|nr:pyridoxal-phosphate dependent enzyme [Dehalococcoidia bacterium]
MIKLGDITSAQQIIAGQVHRTPLLSSMSLGRRTKVHLHFKAEVFQKTGSFKPRGAINKLYHLTEAERKRGAITMSSGNHAQGFAYAASLFGIPATVVMSHTAPANKVNATKGYGAEVILTEADLATTCLEIQKERNLTMVHPFDDPYIVAGQGTVGLEILDDLPEVDVVFVAIGGGGLISGIATAIKLKKPAVKIVGVEPIGASAMWQSLQRKAVVHLDKIDTIAEGLAAPFVGELNLALVQKYVDELVLVSDDEMIEALCLILERAKLLTEPAGAASFAALLYDKVSIPSGSQVVCLLSGGNIDRSRLGQFLLKRRR